MHTFVLQYEVLHLGVSSQRRKRSSIAPALAASPGVDSCALLVAAAMGSRGVLRQAVRYGHLRHCPIEEPGQHAVMWRCTSLQ